MRLSCTSAVQLKRDAHCSGADHETTDHVNQHLKMQILLKLCHLHEERKTKRLDRLAIQLIAPITSPSKEKHERTKPRASSLCTDKVELEDAIRDLFLFSGAGRKATPPLHRTSRPTARKGGTTCAMGQVLCWRQGLVPGRERPGQCTRATAQIVRLPDGPLYPGGGTGAEGLSPWGGWAAAVLLETLRERTALPPSPL